MGSPTVAAPKARNLTNELLQTYRGQAATAQPYFDLESFFQPKYGQVNLGNMAQNLFGYTIPKGATTGSPITTTIPGQHGGNTTVTDVYSGRGPSQSPGFHPGTLQLGAAANTFQRGADVSDVAKFGPGATAAFLNANPFLASGLTNLLGRTQDSPLLQMLNQNATTALQQNGQLSPQDVRASDQSSREALAARGLLTSAPSAVADVLNRDALVRARQGQAQQFASGVQGLNQNQADLVGRASQIFSTTLSDPFQAILGRPSGAAAGGGGGYPQQVGTGAKLFDPTNPYASDLYNTNFNASAAANIANANSSAATQSGLVSAGGSILGAVLPALIGGAFEASDKRIKKSIKRTKEKTRAGIPIKTFEYKTDPLRRRFRGVMAQDVEKIIPMAVRTDPLTGMKRVNYKMADAPFDFIGGKQFRKAA